MHWIIFLVSALVTVLAGIRLTIFADKLSDKLKLGKLWIGIVLLGMVTSLPEAITTIFSIISLNAENMAVGNLLGSNNVNPMLLVMMDFLYRKGSVSDDIHPQASHRVSAFFAVVLTLIVVLEIGFSSFPKTGPLTIGGILICFMYFYGMHKMSKLDADPAAVIQPELQREAPESLAVIWLNLLASAAVVTIAAIWLAKSADTIALQTGLGRTFVGTILLAFVTSLPELVVTLSAMRLGTLDLAVGNVYGSNMTNMFILVLCGLVSPDGALVDGVSKTHVITGVSSIALVLISITGIMKKGKKKYFRLGWDSIIMLILFILGSVILYQLR